MASFPPKLSNDYSAPCSRNGFVGMQNSSYPGDPDTVPYSSNELGPKVPMSTIDIVFEP